MVFLFQLLVFGVLGLLAVNLWNAFRRGGEESSRDGSQRQERDARGPVIDGVARDISTSREAGPGKAAAETLRAFENARAALKARYPSVFAMLGGYLNEHTIRENGGVEGAVRRMIEDWTGRREEVSLELTRLLAENESEEETRAIVLAACDADFEVEGYRKWLTWLLGRFNALS